MCEREIRERERPERKRAGPVEGEREQRDLCEREIRGRETREKESRARVRGNRERDL